ncbi:thioredoxin [Lachnospiraceae bacterium]|nr:thioredoxin [Lachnospiraceae bacterium]
MVNQITEETFEAEVLKSSDPVLVDFYADWCGPCKMMAPVISELSEKFQTKMKFYKCNVDECQDIAQKYGVMSIPTVIIFKEGQPSEPIVGAQPRKKLESAIEEI